MTKTEIDFLTGLTEAHGRQIVANAKKANPERPRYTEAWQAFRKTAHHLQQLVIEHPEVQLSIENFKFIWNTRNLL